jgi:hypothetical protein
MRIVKKILEEVEKVKDFICNKCEKSCYTYGSEMVSVYTMGWSGRFIDQNLICQFDLCEQCTAELTKTFKISPFSRKDDGDEYSF